MCSYLCKNINFLPLTPLSISLCVAHTPLKGEVDLFALFMVEAECVFSLLSNKAVSAGYKGSHSY